MGANLTLRDWVQLSQITEKSIERHLESLVELCPFRYYYWRTKTISPTFFPSRNWILEVLYTTQGRDEELWQEERGNKIVLMADYGVGDYANSTWLLAVSAAHCEVSLRVATFNEIFHPIKGEWDYTSTSLTLRSRSRTLNSPFRCKLPMRGPPHSSLPELKLKGLSRAWNIRTIEMW